MGGLIGRLFHEFAVTLSVAILVSAVVSLTLTPMLCGRFLQRGTSRPAGGWFYETMERFFDGMLGGYERGLRWVLRHQCSRWAWRWLTVVATVVCFTQSAERIFPAAGHGAADRLHRGRRRTFPSPRCRRSTSRLPTSSPPTRPWRRSAAFVGGGADNNGLHVHLAQAARASARSAPTRSSTGCARSSRKSSGISLFLQAAQDLRVGGRAGQGRSTSTRSQSADLDELRHWTPLLVDKLKTVTGLLRT